jgi:hypothetical protein
MEAIITNHSTLPLKRNEDPAGWYRNALTSQACDTMKVFSTEIKNMEEEKERGWTPRQNCPPDI